METIRITIEALGDRPVVHLVRLSGTLHTLNVDVLRQRMASLFGGGKIRLVLDCTELLNITSTGLGILLYLNTRCRFKGGFMKFAGLDEDALELIGIIGATRQLELYDTLEEALSSLPAPLSAVARRPRFPFVKKHEAGIWPTDDRYPMLQKAFAGL